MATASSPDRLTREQRESLLYRLAQDYRDLNGTKVEVWTHTPSPIEFARIVNVGRPVLFRNTPSTNDLPALTRWTDDHLVTAMRDRKVSVAVTPNGRADALHTLPNGTRYFVEPHTEHMTMEELFQAIKRSEQDPSNEVYYLQSQNGNMYSAVDFESGPDHASNSELCPELLADVPREIPWASEALGRTPDAVNVWIGGSRSVTSVHSGAVLFLSHPSVSYLRLADPYENIYSVIRGSKHFTLLPPTEGYTLHEQRVPHAKYTRPAPFAPLEVEPIADSTVLWAEVDPTLSSISDTEIGAPLRVSVKAGDALYLPAGWWHHVAQSGDRQNGVCIAVNWWYDVEMRGMTWTWMSFLRRMAAPDGEEDEA
ncbi:phospholipase [Rhizoctonia solani 123E]|uniref:Phospholipase n=1 Tax=Rhizoctonia solani 123E TaxID=1423351 RepID=A0A074RZ97_9AGAM|nr:phospholipase [Rhizoctonia solani 123E]